MTASAGDKGDLSAPPEVEAELVDAPGAEAPTPAAAEPAKPKRRTLWPLGVAAVGAVAIGGAGYFGVGNFLKERAAAEKVAGSPAAVEQVEERVAEPAAEVPAPAVDQELSAPPAESTTDSALIAGPPQDSVAAAAPPAQPAAAAPPETVPAVVDVTAAAAPAAPAAASNDPLAELQAQAEVQAAEESDGAAVEPASAPLATPAAVAAPAEGVPQTADVAGELKALRALFETETGRLAAELGAERARAEAQAAEIAALRASLAAFAETAELQSSVPEASPPAVAAAPVAVAPSPRRNDERATLVLFALARAVESGKPYKAELARAEALAPNTPAIERLRVDAADGAPTLAALKARFPIEMRRALAADAGKGGGLMGRFSAGAAELVSVRPSGPVKGASARAVLSRAEAAFAADDVDVALGELKALQGPAREAMAPFVAEAARFSAARGALADLNIALIEAAAG